MLSEQHARALLREGHVAPAPLALQMVDGCSSDSLRGDFLIDLTWGGVRKGFVAEYKAVATPKRVEAAVREAKAYAREHGDRLPMVLLPHISEDTAETLQSEGVSGLDFSGNVAVTVPGEWLVIRTGKPNRHPSSQPIKHVYEGKSALVGRALLGRPEYDMIKDVRAEVERRGGSVSMGTVSKVLSALEEDLIVTKSEGVRLVQPAALLNRLADHYDGPGATKRRSGKAPLGPQFYRDLLESVGEAGARVIGRDESLYVVAPTSQEPTQIYVSRLSGWLDGLPFQETDRFANVEFVEVADAAAFFDPTVRDGLPWCSALQVYLELAGGGKRERDTAAQLRGDLLAAARLTAAPATP